MLAKAAYKTAFASNYVREILENTWRNCKCVKDL
jgi:hypothetical protein